MYRVITLANGRREAKTFRQAPEALNCAVGLVAKHGGAVSVAVEDAVGKPVFTHDEIVRTCAQLKLDDYRETLRAF